MSLQNKLAERAARERVRPAAAALLIGQRGLTLVELLLALALSGLLVTALAHFYFSGVRTWQKSLERLDQQQNARVAAEMIDRELRFACWIEVPAAEQLRYRLSGDWVGEGSENYRCFTLSGEQLVMKEIREQAVYSYNVVALGIRKLKFSADRSGRIHLSITAGDTGGAVTLRSSIFPRNLPSLEAP